MNGRTFIQAVLAGALVLAWPAAARAADDIHAWADRVSGQVKGKGQDLVVLEGNVRITQGKTEILADRAAYDKNAGTILFTGRVQLAHEGIQVTAQELLYHRASKEGTFRGEVRLARKEEKDEGGKTTKDAFTLTCAEMDFAAEKKSFTARGQAVLEHKDFSATAGEISYDDEHQELRLRQEPTLKREDETIRAEEIVVAVEEDTFKIIKAEITFTVEEEEEGEKGETSATDGAPGGGSTPPQP